VVQRPPRTGIDALDSVLGTFSMEPEAIAAVLHGILVGPVAPEIEERRAIPAPALIIGHANDLIHPFNDAENLAEQLPNARLIEALDVRAAPASRALDAGDRLVFRRGVRQKRCNGTPHQRSEAIPEGRPPVTMPGARVRVVENSESGLELLTYG
jgi:hypothetical protein